jgi:plastocyanin
MNSARARSFVSRYAALLVIPAAIVAAACGSNSYTTSNPATKAPGAAAPLAATGSAAAVSANIQNTSFPATISVKPGTKVTWTNKDSFEHTVTADSGQSETFDSKNIAGGATFSMTFTKAGTFKYHCNIHPTMHGTVVVDAQATGVSTPDASKTEVPGYGY